MTVREREILNGVRGMLDQALARLPVDEPDDEDHARGWITRASEQLDRLLQHDDD